MSKLAILGGNPVRDTKINPWPKWPVWDKNEEKALIETLKSGIWSYNGPKETEFNRRFAEYYRSEICSISCKRHCYSSNGT